MIYTPLTIKAMKIAYDAHQGQFDKSGVPYIFHPYHLAEQMDDEISCAAALLHDVVEDTDVTLEDLKKEFPTEVTDAISLLTHNESDEYLDYVRKLKNNPVAKKIKLADLTHNSDDTRNALGTVTAPEKRQMQLEKYAKEKKILLEE